MSKVVTLELPDDLAEQVEAAAGTIGCRVEDVVLEWLRRAAHAADVTALHDDILLKLCHTHMPESDQTALSDLLAKQRHGELDGHEVDRLASLMDRYRHDVVVKAQALTEAAKRGLKP
jgi:predicted transcriptional regulator